MRSAWSAGGSRAVWREDPGDPLTLTIGELDLFFEGSAIIGRMPLAPPALTQFSPGYARRLHRSRASTRVRRDVVQVAICRSLAQP
jgi:hypothetical protein